PLPRYTRPPTCPHSLWCRPSHHPRAIPLFFSIVPPPPRSTLFPYTTLFRSRRRACRQRVFGRRPLAPRAVFHACPAAAPAVAARDRKSTRLNSSHVSISYAVFCLKKKKE